LTVVEGIAVAAVVLLQLVFTMYLIPLATLVLAGNIARPAGHGSTEESAKYRSLKVGVLIPLYREDSNSAIKTIKSIISQTYSKSLMRVYLILEDGDGYTKRSLTQLTALLRGAEIKYKVIHVNSSRRYGKAEALNKALKYVRGEDVAVVFDADNDVPPTYIEDVVKALSEGAEAVTTKVYRDGGGLHAKLLMLDTIFWYDIVLPSFLRLSPYIPLSGEGLAVSTKFLKKVGGFPRALTEDAYLAVQLAERGSPVRYLKETYITEKAPRNFLSQLRQRVRWFQGYFECLAAAVKKARRIGLVKSVPLLITFTSPVAAIATAVSDVIFLAYWIAYLVGYTPVLQAIRTAYPAPVFYWGLTLLVIGNVFITYLLLYVIADSKFEKYSPYVFLMPVYWFINGVVAIAALFLPKKWRKTLR